MRAALYAVVGVLAAALLVLLVLRGPDLLLIVLVVAGLAGMLAIIRSIPAGRRTGRPRRSSPGR
jgi:hypothetical protein